MPCINPPEISDCDLVAAAEGEWDDRVQAHLQACPDCAQEVRAMQRAATALTTLYRHDCPTPEELSDFQARKLARPAHRRIARHLDSCPDCAAELESLVSFLAELTPAAAPQPTKVLTPAWRFWQRLQPQPRLAPAAVALDGWRTARPTSPLRYAGEGLEVTLSIGELDRRKRLLRGRIQPVEAAAGALLVGGTAYLLHGLEEAAMSPVDERGVFAFADVSPGDYAIELVGADREWWLDDVHV